MSEYVARASTVHRSLLETKSTAGAEFAPAVANVTLMMVMLMGPNLLWWPVITIGIQLFLKWMFGVDDRLSMVFMRYLREGDVYDPWPRANQSQNKRPFGMGRDIPLC